MTKVVLPGQNTAGQPNGYAALDGNSGLLVPAYLARTAQAAPAAPVSGFRDYVDSADGQHKTIDPAGTIRRIVRDYGVGTNLPTPTVGTSRGDVYTHSGVGCQFTWNGAQWRQSTRAITTTESQLGAIATAYSAILHDGLTIFAQDSKAVGVWDATAGRFVFYDSVWQTYAVNLTVGGPTNIATINNGVRSGRYFRKGREVSIQLAWGLGTASTYNGQTGVLSLTPPPGLAPVDVSGWGSGVPVIGRGVLVNSGFAQGDVVIEARTSTGYNAAANRRFQLLNSAATAAQGNAGTGWAINASGQNITMNGVYETNFEA